MTTSLFAADALFAPLRQLVRVAARAFATRAVPQATSAADTLAACAAGTERAPAPRRLRVVRVVEGTAAASAGRMVISGRMADVCAELDRLAALEAAAG